MFPKYLKQLKSLKDVLIGLKFSVKSCDILQYPALNLFRGRH